MAVQLLFVRFVFDNHYHHVFEVIDVPLDKAVPLKKGQLHVHSGLENITIVKKFRLEN